MAIHPRTPTPRYQRAPYPPTRVAAHQYRGSSFSTPGDRDPNEDLATLTPQQKAVCEWVSSGTGNAFVEAVAGSGKTWTLRAACGFMSGSVAYCVFNKKNADEAKPKLSHLPNVTPGTFHSFGFSAWRAAHSRPLTQAVPAGDKWVSLVRAHVKKGATSFPLVDAEAKKSFMLDECQVPQKFHAAVTKMVGLAKQSVCGKVWQVDDIEEWKRLISHHDILLSVKENGLTEPETIAELIRLSVICITWSRRVGTSLIDFDDMIYLPLVEDTPVRRYDWVLVDEAQDTNPARRLLATRMLKPGGRAVFVGDRNQAIYGFTGADADAVDLIIREFQCQSLSLTTTFRCSKTATRLAQEYVPQIEAAENNAEGTVSYLEHEGLLSSLPQPGSAILCRNTKPLVELAFTLIKEGVGCHVEGRDIGKGLERLATKWKTVTRVADLLRKLEEYRYREIQKLSENGFQENSYAIDSLNDRIDCLIAVSDGCYTVDDILLKIKRIFQDTEDPSDARKTVTLSTIHKAKGREWETVYQLGFDALLPSRHARQPWQRDQERNLQYVTLTRTKRDTIFLSMQEREDRR